MHIAVRRRIHMDGMSVLHWASTQCYARVVKGVLDAGEDFDSLGRYGGTQDACLLNIRTRNLWGKEDDCLGTDNSPNICMYT
jgi:hypothetical protein